MGSTVVKKFEGLGIWSRGDERAPHKPLLILYALGRWQHGNISDIPYPEVDRELNALLREFGPPRQSFHPEYPFWRLQNDGIWVVHSDGPMKSRASNTDPPKSELLSKNARGGFTDEVKLGLQSQPFLVAEIARSLLERHFPESLHADILETVGIAIERQGERKREPKFRHRILTAYEYRCAVCGFDVRLGSVSIALDAAHIRWHQAGGPETEDNGLALCVMHHKAFDLGAFGIREDGIIVVSDQVNGSTGLQEWLLDHHGRPIRAPQRPEWSPCQEHIEWHGREVFKGSARHLE